MIQESRKDELTAQKVETGLVFLQMLGADDARRYLLAEEVPPDVVDRLLAEGLARRTDSALVELAPEMPPSPEAGYGFYCHGGRRKDVVRSAVVQAALVVRDQMGVERAFKLLRREGFPDEVTQRVLHGEPQQRRVAPAGRTQTVSPPEPAAPA